MAVVKLRTIHSREKETNHDIILNAFVGSGGDNLIKI